MSSNLISSSLALELGSAPQREAASISRTGWWFISGEKKIRLRPAREASQGWQLPKPENSLPSFPALTPWPGTPGSPHHGLWDGLCAGGHLHTLLPLLSPRVCQDVIVIRAELVGIGNLHGRDQVCSENLPGERGRTSFGWPRGGLLHRQGKG